MALEAEGPAALILTRQKLKSIDRAAAPPAREIAKGAYVLSDPSEEPRAIIFASGSEVGPALEAVELLGKTGIPVRLVNVASFELFGRQPEAYREGVLLPGITARLAVEAASPFGWERFVGMGGRIIGINRFGASAPGKVNMEKFGFTADNIAGAVKELLAG